MSSRYQDRDRDEGRYSRDASDNKERGHDRDRRRKYEPEEETYRSPRRDGDRPRPTTDRARSRSPKREPGSSRYDERDDRERRGRGPNNDPNYRAPVPRNEHTPTAPGGHRGGYADRGRGGYGRGGGGNEGRGGGRGGYGGGGGGGRGGYQQSDYDRPLDRRAIEEGRRKREEERAMGLQGRQEGDAPYPEEEEKPQLQEGEEEEEEDPMAAMMGFGGFGTTKNKSTGQYEGSTANVHTQRTWRQYMNRRGGFNRALDKVTK